MSPTAARLLAVACCLAALLVACGKEERVVDNTDTREALEVAYVGAPELKVHQKADPASPVVATFLSGESVSVMARKGEWTEVRTTNGTGWALTSELTNAVAAAKEEATPTPRFQKMPSPISAPSIHGSIYIEANVNNEGQITSTKILTNTTGSESLAERNAAALMLARFYPIVVKGQKKEFIYYYRVDY